MKGIQWKEFVDVAYLGADAFMRYHNRIFQYGGYYDTCYCIYICAWTDKEPCDDVTEVLEITSDSNEAIWQKFLSAKIFDGKTIEEAGDEVEFLYWG
ncbi:MAG: hypothetical protein IJ165_08605 [Proteobacteria bacterium]|nr:hypothetical protein [Pseudomonadota bacterium]